MPRYAAVMGLITMLNAHDDMMLLTSSCLSSWSVESSVWSLILQVDTLPQLLPRCCKARFSHTNTPRIGCVIYAHAEAVTSQRQAASEVQGADASWPL